MGLSCECDDDYDYYYDAPEDYVELDTSKRKRCMSCNQLNDIGSTVVKFPIWRKPNNDIEERIHGDEIPLANKYMCEECGDIYFSLVELGFCVNTGFPMKELLAEYQHDYVKSAEPHPQ